MKYLSRVIGVILLIVGLGLALAPRLIEAHFNRVTRSAPYQTTAQAEELHKRLVVADLHADSLLWGRDLLALSSRGHVDIPRMQEGNVAIQAFTVVTKVPKHLNIQRNSGSTDEIRTLAMVELWPPRTWKSPLQRALYQAERLQGFAVKSKGEFTLLRTRADLIAFLERRKTNQKLTSGFLGIEGAQALEGNLNNLDRLFKAGYRMVSPSHFFDTEIGGSAAGERKGGLTPLGREWVRKMEEKEMIIDLAHASAATIRDVTSMAKRPVLVSHTGVKGTCNNNRNLSDDQLHAVANTGGIVGIGFWDTATCGHDAAAIARAIQYAAKVIGVDHVALGSDFDGTVTVPFDESGMKLVTQELMRIGFSDEQIGKIMGGNVVKFLEANLREK